MLHQLILHLLDQVGAAIAQLGQTANRVDDQVKAVDVVEDPHVEGGGDGALLLIAPDVEVLVVAAIVVNMLFVSKKVDKGCVRGYLVKVELSSGLLFDSYECTMVTDYPDRVTDANDLIFHFSVRDQKLGEKIYKAMRGDSVLLVDYVRYSMKMPWRGNTDVYVDSATVMKLPVLRSPEQVALDKATYGAKPDTTKRG